MIDLDFSFEELPWEQYLNEKKPGEAVSAGELLTLLEGEEEQTVEEALNAVEEKGLVLEVSDLPRTLGFGETALRLGWEKELASGPLRPELLEEGDPLKLFLEEVAQIPACGDEQMLAQDAVLGDAGAGERLVNLGLSRVIEIAREYVGFGVLLLDLIQEGSLGLWQSVGKKFGEDYRVFRDRMIHSHMAKAVFLQARANGVGQKLRSAMEDFRQVDERLLGELGRNPTLEEIAQELHMKIEEAACVQKMLSDAQSLARIRPEQEEQTEQEAHLAVEDTALFQSRARVQELLSGLTKQEARLLSLRFGLEGGRPLSPEESGAKLGLTREQTMSLEKETLEKLRSRGINR